MDILNNLPQTNLSSYSNDSVDHKNKLKFKLFKWFAIVAYLVVIVGSLFTF
ncbi:MAG: hypothetical protein IPK06_07530 [Ignavibacteriae bacterium]|nr:hypothetical protein [Ignavibacteriota bacterium]